MIPTRGVIKLSQTIPKEPTKPPPVQTFPPYIPPPDSLMSSLCRAIETKSWGRARQLCRELVFYDPWRQDYHDLYNRIEEILDMADRRYFRRIAVTKPVTPNSVNPSAGTNLSDFRRV